MREYDIEREHREHIQTPKQKSILEKDRQPQFFHKFGAKASKVLTSEMKHTGDPQDEVRLQNLFPLPSENYESPIQLYHNPTHHWTSDDEILEIWNTPEMEERARKYHSIVALFKYIRSRPLLCALIYDCFYIPWITGVFLTDFAPQLAGSYLIALEKPNGGIRETYPNFKQLALSKARYLERVRYLMRSTRIGSSFSQSL
jgi:hypothetical protein